MALVDAAATWPSEEAVGSISQDTQIQWSLFSLFHPELQTIFSIRFPVVFRSESRGVFLVCFGYLVLSATQDLRRVLVVALLFTADHPWRRCVDKQTPAEKCSSATSSGRTTPLSGCANNPTIRTRGSVGVGHVSLLSGHMSFSQSSARAQHCHSSFQLKVESGFRHIFEHSSACGNIVIFSRVPLCFSVPLLRIWLSRSTSKIDALDDDEKPLRFTASQTATTRGVMVSGIMGACDIAPSSHFVEPGLKLNAEEWIKVMDEYIVPNYTALMEPGGKFLLILDNAPSHASRLACEHYSTVLHCTVEFQPPCSPDLSPLDFSLWNELKVQLVHPAPALQNCGHF